MAVIWRFACVYLGMHLYVIRMCVSNEVGYRTGLLLDWIVVLGRVDCWGHLRPSRRNTIDATLPPTRASPTPVVRTRPPPHPTHDSRITLRPFLKSPSPASTPPLTGTSLALSLSLWSSPRRAIAARLHLLPDWACCSPPHHVLKSGSPRPERPCPRWASEGGCRGCQRQSYP